MTFRLADDVLLAATTAIHGAAGGPGALLRVYTGVLPGSLEVVSGIMLLEYQLPDPPFTDPSATRITLNLGTGLSVIAVAAGEAGWARLVRGDGTAMYDGEVGLSAENKEFAISSTSMEAGDEVFLTAGAISLTTS